MLKLLLTLLPFICTAMYSNASVPQKQMAQIIQSLFIGWSTAVESEAFKGLRADKNLKNCSNLIALGKLSRPFCSISKSYISVTRSESFSGFEGSKIFLPFQKTFNFRHFQLPVVTGRLGSSLSLMMSYVTQSVN